MATTGRAAAHPTDGRNVRWAAHRAARREELVVAAAGAIAEHGPDVHLGEIATSAGVSKPVLYRYFSDKDDLLAVRHHTHGVDGSVADGKAAAAGVLTRTLERALSAAGADTSGAEPWAHAVVGVGISMAEWWLERGTVGRDLVEEHLTAFIWHAFDGLSREYGLSGPENVTQS